MTSANATEFLAPGASRSMPSGPAIESSYLQAADVLLFHGTDPIARAIQLFDESPFFHAALALGGGETAEALVESGISKLSIADSLDRRSYAVAFRHKRDARKCNDGTVASLDPVVSRARAVLKRPPRYAHEQLLPLALLLITRQIPETPSWAAAVVGVLDAATALLGRMRSVDREFEPMVCSGFVFYCFETAVSPCDARPDMYRLEVPRPTFRAVSATGKLVDEVLRATSAQSDDMPLRDGGRVVADVEALLEKYLHEIAGHVDRSSATLAGPPREDVHDAIRRFAVAFESLDPDRAVPRLGDALRNLAARADRLITAGDLGRSPSMADLGRVRHAEGKAPDASPRGEDFVLQISPQTEATYRAAVLSSPAGEGWTTFAWDDVRAAIDCPQDASAAETIGARLFSRVFGHQVGQRYRESLAISRGRPLRVQIRIPAPARSGQPDSALHRLHRLCWECLHDQDRGLHVALSLDTPLVRYLEMPGVVPARPWPARVRMLAVASNPVTMNSLNLQAEYSAIASALAHSNIDLQLAPVGDAEGLRDFLLHAESSGRGGYDILHFMGHGSFESGVGGELHLEGKAGMALSFSSAQLATILQELPSLRLVCINACESGATSESFDGVAARLLRLGIPAVVGMRFKIRDATGIAFAKTFYGALPRVGLEAAITEARVALIREPPREWAAPVLYTRTGATDNLWVRSTRRPWLAVIVTINVVVTLPLLTLLIPEPWRMTGARGLVIQAVVVGSVLRLIFKWPVLKSRVARMMIVAASTVGLLSPVNATLAFRDAWPAIKAAVFEPLPPKPKRFDKVDVIVAWGHRVDDHVFVTIGDQTKRTNARGEVTFTDVTALPVTSVWVDRVKYPVALDNRWPCSTIAIDRETGRATARACR